MKSLAKPGALLALSGLIVFGGIFLAQHYFEGYSSRTNAISDLGQNTNPFNATSTSLFIFNTAMIVAGILIALSATLLRSTSINSMVTRVLLIHGVAVAGVGIFPTHINTIHFTFALLTFLTGELVAIASFFTTESNIRFAFLLLGLISFIALLMNWYLQEHLGVGGAERWIVYPTTLWLIIYGLFLMRLSKVK